MAGGKSEITEASPILKLQHRLMKASDNLIAERGDVYGGDVFRLNDILAGGTTEDGGEKHVTWAGEPHGSAMKKTDVASLVGIMADKDHDDEEKEAKHHEHIKGGQGPIVFHEYNVVLVMLYLYECLYEKIILLHELLLEVEEALVPVNESSSSGDCFELSNLGIQSGYYTIYLEDSKRRPVTVYCDMETDGGGWMVVQRRQKGAMKHVSFINGWHSYKVGFGDPKTEFWLGLENMYILTNRQKYELRIDLKSEDGKTAFAKYSNFYLEAEDKNYRLHVSGYRGTAGDAFGGKYSINEEGGDIPSGVQFSTIDRDHSKGNCTSKFYGGWWYLNCGWDRLNSPHLSAIEHYRQGMKWSTFTPKVIEDSTMMIRPVAYTDTYKEDSASEGENACKI